jgi:hypothetical protein
MTGMEDGDGRRTELHSHSLSLPGLSRQPMEVQAQLPRVSLGLNLLGEVALASRWVAGTSPAMTGVEDGDGGSGVSVTRISIDRTRQALRLNRSKHRAYLRADILIGVVLSSFQCSDCVRTGDTAKPCNCVVLNQRTLL